MKLLKRDFVPAGTTSVRNYVLTSGKAYFIKNHDGEILYASTQYVRENFSDTERREAIDLTKGLLKSNTHIGGVGNNSGENYTEIDEKLKRQKIAIAYLILTQEKLAKFTGYKKILSNNFLVSTYNVYKQNNYISEKRIDAVLKVELDNRETKNKHNCRVVSYKNLETCYAYEYKIKRAIDELNHDKRDYMQSMLESLYAYLYLSDKQIEGMKKWFEHLPTDLKEAKLREFDLIRCVNKNLE